MPKWTDPQQNAIDARNSNILVSAAAGSGKTAVLVERVVKLICDEKLDAGIDKLLIVTFTNAAAAEMKNRISRALYEIIKKEPNNHRALSQLALLPSAKICTIDSFCINLVRENFFKLDISQDFTILDDSQQLLIEQTALEEIIEEHYKSENDDFKALVELLSASKNDDDLIKAIKRISSYISAQPFPFDWLDDVCELYNPAVSIDESGIKEYVFSEIAYFTDYIKGVIDDCLLNIDIADDMFDEYSALLEGDLALINGVDDMLNASWNEMKETVDSVSFASMPRTKKDYEGSAKQLVADSRKQYKEVFGDIKKLIKPTAEEFTSDNEFLYQRLKYLCSIVLEYNKKMLEIKKEMNSYSFSDIEHFAIDLLFRKVNGEIIKTDLACEYEKSFYEILVDEYQDTNSAQDMLFEMLSNGKNRFMVGDIKQSIYRFRLAMPEIFSLKKDSFAPYNEENTSFNQKIILDKNFRSRQGICDYTNFVFSNLMSKRIGELDYNEEEFLNCGAEYIESDIPSAQICVVQTPEDEDGVEYEARQIAKLIIDKVNSKEQIKDGDTYRDICFSDFAVLLRYTKNRIDVYSKVFSEYSIPVNANNKTNLFESNEVSILISLLRVIDNPTRDVPLLATLMSVFYGFTADDIARVRVGRKSENLYTSICRDKETFGKFIEDIDTYRKYASSMNVESFLRQLIGSTSYLSLISAMGNSEQRRLNVLKLLELAHRFDKGENVGITAFMRYVDSIIASNLGVEGASVVNSRENCVSIMSVHQSKGLEFPICIFASTSHKYNNGDLSDLVLLNSNVGIGLKVNDEERLIRYNSLQYDCLQNMNSCAAISENLRLLYVAITRAKEQFISFISMKDVQTHINGLSKKIIGGYISPIIVKKAQNDGDLLLLTALLHKDASSLRKLCERNIEFDTNSSFALKVDFSNDDTKAETAQEDIASFNSELVDEIREKLSYSYDKSALSAYSSKRSASQLDERERGYKYFAKSKPAFLSKSELTPAQRGTAMHTFMQFCDYELAKADLEKEINRLTESSYITEIQANALNREKLKAFFSSDFAKRMFESDGIYREIKVSSFVKASEIERTDFEDEILVQGIADCVFEENGELVLVDYKTDYVSSEEELLDLYKNQIGFYKNAVSKTLEKPVKEAMLYSFCLDKPCIYR
jgi:ATP-dependent helicase/nuclease subunit A